MDAEMVMGLHATVSNSSKLIGSINRSLVDSLLWSLPRKSVTQQQDSRRTLPSNTIALSESDQYFQVLEKDLSWHNLNIRRITYKTPCRLQYD